MNANDKLHLAWVLGNLGLSSHVMSYIEALSRLSKQHHRGCEDECNGVNLVEHDGYSRSPLCLQAEAQIKAIFDDDEFKICGISPVFSGDPRGCTVKLTGEKLKRYYNSFGGEGYCL